LSHFLLRFFSIVMNHFARKRHVLALEKTIEMFLHYYERQSAQLFLVLCRFSDDSRWVLRYIAGREMSRFVQEEVDKAANIWFKLADDENLYVREGVAKGITDAAETNVEVVWRFWEKAFYHSSDKVRQTAAMTFIKFWEKPLMREQLLSVLPQIQKDASEKVKAIYENYIAPLLVKDEKASISPKDFATTEELPVFTRLIDQVVGQDQAVEIIRLAAQQKRSVLLIGEPGTGKSMLGQAMSELLPASTLEDIIVEAGEREKNIPKVRRLPAGEAEKLIKQREKEAQASVSSFRWVVGFAALVSVFVSLFYYFTKNNPIYIIGGLLTISFLYWFTKSMKVKPLDRVPKCLVNHSNTKRAPFIDATGLHAGALLGDVRHDPYQSGGLETMPHHLVEPGAIHLAHNGVLFIDEVSTLSLESQQALLTAFQEKKLAITGRSQGSSGTMIRTEPVPCDFIMVLAGNVPDIEKIHPALRSRIRGYGYEIYTNTTMDDTEENRYKLALFVAQEVRKDGKIPHFTREAVHAIIETAKEMSPYSNQLTTRFRELGGLIRAAGDMAIQSNSSFVHQEHVQKALHISRTVEEQLCSEAKMFRDSYSIPCPGKVKALTVYKDSIGQIVQVCSGVQPLEYVDIKISNLWTDSFNILPIEAALNRLCLHGRYYIEMEGVQRGEKMEEVSLAIILSAMSAKYGLLLPDDVAVCGNINIMGMVIETPYFAKKVRIAKRSGIKKIIAPLANQMQEAPTDMEFIWVETVDDVYHAIQSIECVTSK
jgi:Lon-like ATP-dependent protease